MTAKCKMCSREITCPIVGSEQEKSFALGQLLLEHFQKYHSKYLKQLSQDAKIFSGFVLMNRFIIDDKRTIDDVEDMREKLAEIIMEDGPPTDAEMKLEAIMDIITGEDDIELDENGNEVNNDEEIQLPTNDENTKDNRDKEDDETHAEADRILARDLDVPDPPDKEGDKEIIVVSS